MSRIVYLLGAGASIGSLPVVEDFEDKIEKILEMVRGCLRSTTPQHSNREYIEVAYNDLIMLRDGCKNHRSVDTFAKMLFLTSHIDEQSIKYRKTKTAIVLFFELFRFYSNKSDKRYDALIATIMNKNPPRFPKDISILSWNYDYEFERAYTKYVPEKNDIHLVYDDLNMIHRNRAYESNKEDDFCIVKINGTSGFYSKDGKITLGLGCNEIEPSTIINVSNQRIGQICEKYCSIVNSTEMEPAISFSWEEDKGNHKIEDQVKHTLSKCQILIVVGYSFPYFNRHWDSLIFNSIHYGNASVIVQDPLAGDIIENIRGIRKAGDLKYVPIKNCGQFYMAF